eukprot:g5043.t1
METPSSIGSSTNNLLSLSASLPQINTSTISPVHKKVTYNNISNYNTRGIISSPIILRDHKKLSIHGYKSPRSHIYSISPTPAPNVKYTKYKSPTHYDMPPPINRTIAHDKTAGAPSKRLLKWNQSNAQDMWDRKEATYHQKYKYITAGVDKIKMKEQLARGFKLDKALPLSTHNGNRVESMFVVEPRLTPVWCTEVDYKRRQLQFEIEFKRVRKSYKQADLKSIMVIRAQQAEDQTFEKSWKKWTSAHELHDRILELPPPNNKIRPDLLSEIFYNTAPQPKLARPRFMMAMRQMYKFEIANIDSISEPKDLKILDNVLTSFSALGADEIDTRELLSAFKFYTDPTLPTKELLKWCFIVFGSEGTIQWTPKLGAFNLKKINLPTITQLLHNMAGDMSTKRQIKLLINDAFTKLPDKYHGEYITFEAFKYMLDNEPFHSKLSDFNIPHDFLCTFEKNYSVVLQEWLQTNRFNAYRNKQLRKFLNKWRNLRRVKSMEQWIDFTQKRIWVRNLVQDAIVNWRHNQMYSGFVQFRRKAIWIHAAETIQRVYRGHVARVYVENMEEWEAAALTIQRIYRGRKAFFGFLRKMKRRDQAARTLQRVYRGHLGRRRTHKMLLEFYRIKRAQILKEKKEWRAEIRRRAATRIEGVARGYFARQLAKRLRQQKKDKEAGEDAMQEWKREQRRLHLLYCQKMERLWRENKEERERIENEDEIAKATKRLIFMNQQKRWMKERNVQRKLEQAAREERERSVWEEFDQRWMIKQDDLEERTRKLCIKELEERNALLTDEEKLNKKLGKKRIRELVNVVRKERREMGIRAGQSELKAIAEKRYIRERQDKAVGIQNIDKEKERKEKQKELMEEWDSKHVERFKMEEATKLWLIRTLQRLWKCKVAWRPMRKEVDALYQVEFDNDSQNIYYINKKLGTVSWKTPALLYGRKLPKPDKWYVCYDESNIPFYLNPFKDDIKYDAPYDYDGPEVKYIYPGNDPSI